MLSEQFKAVYKEAFSSGVGADFDDPKVQQEYDQYFSKTLTELLDAWTSGQDQPATDEENSIITHPYAESFTEEDAAEITLVRFLGRSLIDLARQNLLENPLVDTSESGEDIINRSWADLTVLNWQILHPKTTKKTFDTISYDPDVASPQRLELWPRGQYINCLGISIGCAALCEEADINYAFANEIRYSQELINERHHEFMQLVERMYGDVLTNPTVREVFTAIQILRPPEDDEDEPQENILFDKGGVLSDRAILPREFHHYVVAEFSDKSDDQPKYYAQVDPFSLVFKGVSGGDEKLNKLIPYINGAKGSTAVVLHDSYQFINLAYTKFSEALRLCSEYTEQVHSTMAHNGYKSGHVITRLYEQAKDIMFDAIIEHLSNPEDDKREIKNFVENSLNIIWIPILAAYLGKTSEANELFEKFMSNADDKEAAAVENGKFLGALEQEVFIKIQQDSSAREELIKAIELVPCIFVLHMYKGTLRNRFDVKSAGSANAVAEFTEPEFMIGAMYLNHYATWRKDGKVNIARELVRLSPSQLLWQAAQQDGPVDDERVLAVEKVVSGLRRRHTHPLVNIARVLQPQR